MINQNTDLIRIAKRENNKKRNYLVINRLQGKHIPVEPAKALDMFGQLADCLRESNAGKKILVIGFAETATAIGAVVAVKSGAYYIQTTREEIAGVSYICFSEEHSHATQQRLVKEDLDQVMPGIERVVFAEDEVTTGHTILNLVDALEQEYPGQAEYAVASILNGMDETSLEVFKERGICLYALVKTGQEDYSAALQNYVRKGDSVSLMREKSGAVWENREAVHASEHPALAEIKIIGCMDARRLVSADAYQNACEKLYREIERRLQEPLAGRILVLGTEEFMYPAMYAADRMAQAGVQVWFHATTRSPAEVYKEAEYPLHVRYELPSLYDPHRRTFVYDIGTYDMVFIITDASCEDRTGLDALIQAVAVKNDKIVIVRWC